MFPSKSESGEVLTTYRPQRLLHQLGFDQGVVLVRAVLGVWEAESYRNALFGDFELIFWPSKSREGDPSVGGALYWLRCLKAFTQFIVPNSVDPTIFAPVVLIPVRDPFLRATKDFGGSTIPI